MWSERPNTCQGRFHPSCDPEGLSARPDRRIVCFGAPVVFDHDPQVHTGRIHRMTDDCRPYAVWPPPPSISAKLFIILFWYRFGWPEKEGWGRARWFQGGIRCNCCESRWNESGDGNDTNLAICQAIAETRQTNHSWTCPSLEDWQYPARQIDSHLTLLQELWNWRILISNVKAFPALMEHYSKRKSIQGVTKLRSVPLKRINAVLIQAVEEHVLKPTKTNLAIYRSLLTEDILNRQTHVGLIALMMVLFHFDKPMSEPRCCARLPSTSKWNGDVINVILMVDWNILMMYTYRVGTRGLESDHAVPTDGVDFITRQQQRWQSFDTSKRGSQKWRIKVLQTHTGVFSHSVQLDLSSCGRWAQLCCKFDEVSSLPCTWNNQTYEVAQRKAQSVRAHTGLTNQNNWKRLCGRTICIQRAFKAIVSRQMIK